MPEAILPRVFTLIFTPLSPEVAFTPDAPSVMLTSSRICRAASFLTRMPYALPGTLMVPSPLSVRLPFSATWKTAASALVAFSSSLSVIVCPVSSSVTSPLISTG